MHQFKTTILEHVLSHDLPALAANRPAILYHYSSLETIRKKMEHDNVRLSHAEYSNDRHELFDEIELIRATLVNQAQSSHSGLSQFCKQVDSAFNARLLGFYAYIFCMCAGITGVPTPQDMLSQWRAYAQDGRGGK